MPTPNPTPPSELSVAKSIILAVHYASSAELKPLRSLFSLHSSTFSKEMQLRVLLCLPETTKPDLYLPLIKGELGETVAEVDTAAVSKISEKTANRWAKELPPLALEAGRASDEGMLLSSYLVCRARNIDRETGALSIVIGLLSPFVGLVTGIDKYLEGIVAILARLTYDYTSEDVGAGEEAEDERVGLEAFEELEAQVGIRLLLARCGGRQVVVNDLKRLVGPYLGAKKNDREGWEVVWGWLKCKIADGNWGDFVEVVTKWDGPVGDSGLAEEYARLSIAGCYACQETGQSAWEGMRAIHRRCSKYVSERQGSKGQKLPGKLGDPFDKGNPLAAPNEASLQLLDLLITSAGVLSAPLANVAEIRLGGSHHDQEALLVRHVRNGPNWAKQSDEEWRRARDGVKWLQTKAKVFDKLTVEEVEKVLLSAMLAATNFDLVKEIYVNGPNGSLGKDDVETGILDAFQGFYDNASNGNKIRGSMKNALGALQILYPRTSRSTALERAYRLTDATHALSHYSLTLAPGIPLLPVQIRIHGDPISLTARLLDSNPKSFAQTETLITIARDLCFGTTGSDGGRKTDARVVGMCIEAALSEGDFETAYSLGMNRLVIMIAENEQNVDEDVADMIWRACFQAGRYRSPYAALVGETAAFGGKALRTVEMRMELLAQALRFCPPSALAEVLASWRRCEEEMLAGLKEEEEEEERREAYWSNNYGEENANTTTSVSRRKDDETPMGLFAVAAGAAKAFRGTAFQLSTSRGDTVPAGDDAAIAAAAVVTEEQRTRKRDMVSGMVTSGLASGLGWVLGAQPNVNRG
ncbi:secretory pathway Sec39 [Tuber magnatum]|uniref:Secretory pathway Sec39 n=1 Tax=Tuber magnatum TaxID=42249 RepID=A0A317SWE6_9PEZI|nr:secretory pathway Sec39 [Tuber magnatum]